MVTAREREVGRGGLRSGEELGASLGAHLEDDGRRNQAIKQASNHTIKPSSSPRGRRSPRSR
eukprot:204226-Prymnesium_polylepis.1